MEKLHPAPPSPPRLRSFDFVWILVLSLAVQLFWAVQISYPTYFDAYYYSINGRQLATHSADQGWMESVIWQYLDDPEGLPTPSHTYWMPLTSLAAAGGHLVAGDGFRAAQLPFVLLTTTLPLLAYAIARHLSPERWAARTAALFTMAGGYYLGQWNQPSTFALFAWVGGGGLLALALALERERGYKWWVAAGLLAGLSHLTRADGLLIAAVGIITLFWKAARSPARPSARLAAPLLYIGGYFLVMGGWFIRMWRVTGTPLSSVGTQTLFLTTYDDTFAYGRHLTLQNYLEWGMGNILRSKLTAVSLSFQTFIAVTGLLFLAVFIVWAWVKLGRAEGIGVFLRPFTLYTFALYFSMSFLFTFPGQRGSLFHSSTAIWPWAMALAAIGIGMVVEWIAGYLHHWQPQKSKPLFAALFVLIVFGISFGIASSSLNRPDEAALYKQIAVQAGERVMLGDPLAFYYHTGKTAVIIPNESPATIVQVMERYGIESLIVDLDHVRPLDDLYAGKEQLPQLKLLYTTTMTTTQGLSGELQLYQLVDE